jgi:hypothetical protein
MIAYRLKVIHKDSALPVEVAEAFRAQEVMDTIKLLLERHPDCHRIRVEIGTGLLFAVDCTGERVDD